MRRKKRSGHIHVMRVRRYFKWRPKPEVLYIYVRAFRDKCLDNSIVTFQARQVQRCLAPAKGIIEHVAIAACIPRQCCVNGRAGIHEVHRDQFVPVPDGQMQWSDAALGFHICFCASIKQEVHHGFVSVARCKMQSSQVHLLCAIYSRSVVEEQFHNLETSLGGVGLEQRLAASIGCVDQIRTVANGRLYPA